MRASTESLLILVLLCAWSTVAAESSAWPTADDIAKSRRLTPFPTHEQLRSQPVPRPPALDGIAVPRLDLEALARAGSRLERADTAERQPSRLRIFVTLAMPRQTLSMLAEQAQRAGAVLVLRGLRDHSLRKTLAVLQEIVGNRQAGWLIDPEAFTRFGITSAPSFVLVTEEAGESAKGCRSPQCSAEAPFYKLSGDVSLDYALDSMVKHRPELRDRIAPYLRRLGNP